MSKRDFEAIARAINTARLGGGCNSVKEDVLLRLLVEHFQASNPRFDSKRFLHACETGLMRIPKPKPIPACARVMGCLCALHARGGKVSAACDAREVL